MNLSFQAVVFLGGIHPSALNNAFSRLKIRFLSQNISVQAVHFLQGRSREFLYGYMNSLRLSKTTQKDSNFYVFVAKNMSGNKMIQTGQILNKYIIHSTQLLSVI